MLVDMHHIETHQNINPAPMQVILRSPRSKEYSPSRVSLDPYVMQASPTAPANTDAVTATGFAGNFSSDSANTSVLRLDKFVQKLDSIKAHVSSKRCARSIRVALQSAGAVLDSHPVAASDWGGTLTKIGYKQIQPAFDNPQEGDIYIIQRTHKHVYGHIAGFSGSEWVSDFKQKSYDVYKENGLKYEYYRLGL
ncbi:peptidoglycan amidohydrolase family protein [Acinetobacter pragensis]|uniref:peptidoglycan amidohydrolase family protein n=1 Tax=Acinetobacter pragensis TaxID=1806892 RepID=UPI003340FFDA